MKWKILIAEDEAILVLLYKVLMQKHGLEVVATADTGQEAISEAERLRPDIILMDIYLKGEIDGIEAATIIKKKLNIPLIYLTGNNDAATRERAFKTDPAGYLEKPVNSENLILLIEKILSV